MTMYGTRTGALVETQHNDDLSFVTCASECGTFKNFVPAVAPTPITDAEAWARQHAESCTSRPI